MFLQVGGEQFSARDHGPTGSYVRPRLLLTKPLKYKRGQPEKTG